MPYFQCNFDRSMSIGNSLNLTSVKSSILRSIAAPTAWWPLRIFEIAEGDVFSSRAKSKSENTRNRQRAQSKRSIWSN